MAITVYGLTGSMVAYQAFAPKADSGGSTTRRRGIPARGRARLRGRRLWWLTLLLLQHWKG